MLWLTKLFSWAGGSALTIPLLGVALLVMVHQRMDVRDARLTESGKQACNSSWLVAFSKQQRETARREAQRAQDIMAEERAIMEGLQNELQKTHDKYAAYIPGDDPRCLSDGVLDALRRRNAVGGGG